MYSTFRCCNISTNSRTTARTRGQKTSDVIPCRYRFRHTNTNTSKRQPGAAPEHQIQTLQQSSSLSAPSNPQTNISTPTTSEPLRCWDSCCNGRTFSNKSNFTRHQREKRNGRAELKCCFCGVGFTRATAKQAHEAERRCRNSGGNNGGGGGGGDGDSSAAR
jgi:hypothetical protein